jgi:hypothetical protein
VTKIAATKQGKHQGASRERTGREAEGYRSAEVAPRAGPPFLWMAPPPSDAESPNDIGFCSTRWAAPLATVMCKFADEIVRDVY